MAKRGRESSAPPGGAAAISPEIRLPTATPLWLHAGTDEKFLLLQDPDTGDVLLPLIYLKAVLGANYSRKLAALKHRQVTVPANSPPGLADKGGLLYWQWAFEAPTDIKTLIRRELGENGAPQGHMRLVLAPIVYNAMVQREDLHTHPLLIALHWALRPSTYWPLLIPPGEPNIEELDTKAAELGASGGAPPFAGPASLEETALKYMFLFKDQEEVEQSKRSRTTGTAVQQEGSAIVEEVVRYGTRQAGTGQLSATAAVDGAYGDGQSLQEAASRPSASAPLPSRSPPPSPTAAAAAAAVTGGGAQAWRRGLQQQPDAGGTSGQSRCGTPAPATATPAVLQGALQPLMAAGQHQQQQLGAVQEQQLVLVVQQALEQELQPLRQRVDALAQEVAAIKHAMSLGPRPAAATAIPPQTSASPAAHTPQPMMPPVSQPGPGLAASPAAASAAPLAAALEVAPLREFLRSQLGGAWMQPPSQEQPPQQQQQGPKQQNVIAGQPCQPPLQEVSLNPPTSPPSRVQAQLELTLNPSKQRQRQQQQQQKMERPLLQEPQPQSSSMQGQTAVEAVAKMLSPNFDPQSLASLTSLIGQLSSQTAKQSTQLPEQLTLRGPVSSLRTTSGIPGAPSAVGNGTAVPTNGLFEGLGALSGGFASSGGGVQAAGGGSGTVGGSASTQLPADVVRVREPHSYQSGASLSSILAGQPALGISDWSQLLQQLSPGALDAAVHALVQHASQEHQQLSGQQMQQPQQQAPGQQSQQ